MSTSESKTITVSREVLRLELDNLALRLTNELATKSEVAEVASRQDAFDRGELSTGLLLAIKAVVLTELSNARGTAWSLRNNRSQLVIAAAAVISLVLSILATTHRVWF